MSLTYTRKQVRTRLNDLTRDTDTGLVLAAVKNRIISGVHRDFVERTHCNRNSIIFSIADATSNGVVEYDKHSADRMPGNTPTLTRVDYEGYNWYKISNCDAVLSIERFVVTDDGVWTQLTPVNQVDVAAKSLLSNSEQYPKYYEMDGPDTFRFLPNLDTTAYTIKVRIKYMESVIDLVSNEDFPTDTSTPIQTTGSGLADLSVITAGTAASYYEFKITGAGAPDSWAWRENGGSWSANIAMTTSNYTVTDGLVMKWATTTGHTLNDVFTVWMDDQQTGNVPLKYRKALVNGAVAEVFALRRDESGAMYYRSLYEQELAEAKADAYSDQHDKPYMIRKSRRSAGA